MHTTKINNEIIIQELVDCCEFENFAIKEWYKKILIDFANALDNNEEYQKMCKECDKKLNEFIKSLS